MLRILYRRDPSATDGRDPARLDTLDSSALHRQAMQVLGQRFSDSERYQLLVPHLADRWLPDQPKATIEALGVPVAIESAQKADERSKDQWLALLRQPDQLSTYAFRAGLRKAFLRTYRVEERVPVSPPRPKPTATGPRKLVGEDIELAYDGWYPHQLSTWQALDDLRASPRRQAGMIVLPTGAGKTSTVVEWLLRQMELENIGVLWLAHQQELVEQAASSFEKLAASRPESFSRTMRVVHGNSGSVSQIRDADVAILTFQSLSKQYSAEKQKTLRAYLKRPTIVVVDEAHHAGAPTYAKVLDHLVDRCGVELLLGLTATPRPTSQWARERVRKRFNTDPIIAVEREELIAGEILARPVLTTVQTHVQLELDATELKAATSNDLSGKTLRRLEGHLRADLVSATYAQHARRWGKTLVFAPTIDAADQLHKLLQATSTAWVLHSRVADRSETLEAFRQARGPCALVSVGMLTEGVDLPDADTAFLARPTNSPILLTQMIGRVLRGPRSGGSETANIVYFEDDFTNFPDLLHPEDVLPDVDITPPPAEETKERRLPPICTDGQEELTAKELLAIRRQVLGPATQAIAGVIRLHGAALAGFYRLDDVDVPVFDHQRHSFDALIAKTLKGTSFQGSPPLRMFEDTHAPYPSPQQVQALVDHVREYGEEPAFVERRTTVDPTMVAEQVVDAGALTDAEREALILDAYETSMARVLFATFAGFEEAVEQAVRRIRAQRRGEHRPAEPERPIPQGRRRKPEKLRRSSTRALEPLWSEVIDRAWDLLPEDVMKRHDPDTAVTWTRRPHRSTWANWSVRLAGKGVGKQLIQVNRLLQAPKSQIPDDLLRYLLYHELLHGLLPAQGHGAEFREYEARFPDSDRLDYELDTLHEKWDTDPSSYAS